MLRYTYLTYTNGRNDVRNTLILSEAEMRAWLRDFADTHSTFELEVSSCVGLLPYCLSVEMAAGSGDWQKLRLHVGGFLEVLHLICGRDGVFRFRAAADVLDGSPLELCAQPGSAVRLSIATTDRSPQGAVMGARRVVGWEAALNAASG